MELIL